MSAVEFWDGFYAGTRPHWSGNANELLVGEVADLAPGDALDVGCGEGGDAIWLARRNWRVTAVDVAAAALARGAERAAASGVSELIRWERHDLDESFPGGTFDLVTACYLQSPVALRREVILRAAAAAVRPGGMLVVIGHAGAPSGGSAGHGPPMPSAAQVLAGLALDAGWDVERCEDVDRPARHRDGAPVTIPDSVVRARRAVDDAAGAGDVDAELAPYEQHRSDDRLHPGAIVLRRSPYGSPSVRDRLER